LVFITYIEILLGRAVEEE